MSGSDVKRKGSLRRQLACLRFLQHLDDLLGGVFAQGYVTRVAGNEPGQCKGNKQDADQYGQN